MTDFDGKVALVTGGASGIGAACARQLIARGAQVLIADSNVDQAAQLATELGSNARSHRVDVSDPEQVRTMVDAVVQHFGALHVAVNSAGVSPAPADVGSTSFEDWRRVIGINLDGVFSSMRYELPAIEHSNGGSIVNVASMLGTVAMPGASPYVAAKHAVIGLTKAAAVEYAQRGIRVNAVAPGFVDTPLLAQSDSATLDGLAQMHPIGRLGTASEIAATVLHLASPAASFTTGSCMIVDGGYTAV